MRGRGSDRWGLEGLTAREREQVRGDSALVAKQVGLWHLAEEHREGPEPVAFLLESPQDPASYMGEGAEAGHEHPSFFEWPVLRRMIEEYGMSLVSFDQGRMEHPGGNLRVCLPTFVTWKTWMGSGEEDQRTRWREGYRRE